MSNLGGQPEPRVVSLNISSCGIPKRAVNSARVRFAGIEGDGHNHQKHYRLEQAVSLQDIDSLKNLNSLGYQLDCGTTGENINVSGLDVNGLPIGTLLDFEGGVQLRLTKVRQPCYVLDSIHPQLKKDILGKCGFYAEVVNEGTIYSHEQIKVYLPSFVGSY